MVAQQNHGYHDSPPGEDGDHDMPFTWALKPILSVSNCLQISGYTQNAPSGCFDGVMSIVKDYCG